MKATHSGSSTYQLRFGTQYTSKSSALKLSNRGEKAAFLTNQPPKTPSMLWHAETSLLVWSSMTYSFSDSYDFEVFFSKISPVQAKAIQHLQLRTHWTRHYIAGDCFMLLLCIGKFRYPAGVSWLSRATGAKTVTLVVYGPDFEPTGEEMNEPLVIKVAGWIRDILPEAKVVARRQTVDEHDGELHWRIPSDEEVLDDEELGDEDDGDSDAERENGAK
jgi:hypothetical protein